MDMRVSGRGWIFIAIAIVIYVGGGFWFSNNGAVEAWIYRIGLLAASVVPLVFVGIYTYLGLHGNAKWWKNPIGTALVQAAVTLVPIAAPLAWVFWVDGGMLTNTWLAWFEVVGPAVSALAWLRLCAIWLTINRNIQNGK